MTTIIGNHIDWYHRKRRRKLQTRTANRLAKGWTRTATVDGHVVWTVRRKP